MVNEILLDGRHTIRLLGRIDDRPMNLSSRWKISANLWAEKNTSIKTETLLKIEFFIERFDLHRSNGTLVIDFQDEILHGSTHDSKKKKTHDLIDDLLGSQSNNQRLPVYNLSQLLVSLCKENTSENNLFSSQ